jgi:hypothetical protein
MGVLDIHSNVLTTYKADVSDQIKGITKLKGEERKHHEERLSQLRATNDGLEAQITTIGKVGLAVGAAGAIAKLAWDGFQASVEHTKLTAASAGADIERLRAASLGLRKETELLADATLLKKGAFALSQQQMEDVERAVVALTRQFPATIDVHKKLFDAVTQLKTDGLQELGIFVDKSGLSMDSASQRAEIFARVMEEVTEASKGVKDSQATAAEKIQATAVSMDDAMDSMKRSLGKLVEAMAPLLEALATSVSLVAQVASVATSLPSLKIPGTDTKLGDVAALVQRRLPTLGNLYKDGKWAYKNLFSEDTPLEALHQNLPDVDLSKIGTDDFRRTSSVQRDSNRWAGDLSMALAKGLDAMMKLPGAMAVEAEREFNESQKFVLEARDRELAAIEERFERAEAFARSPEGQRLAAMRRIQVTMARSLADLRQREATDKVVAELEAELAPKHGRDTAGSPLGFSTTALGEGQLQGILDKFYASGELERRNAGAYRDFNAARSQSLLEQMFGPIEEFDAYARGLQLVTGAAQAAFSAWIDGSASAGEAVKKFFAESLKGQASDLLGKAILHGVYAVGSLAFGDFRGAAQHGVAAAQAGAGAAAIGVLAKALHGGGGGGPTAGGGGGGSSARPVHSWQDTRPQLDQGTQRIYVVGDPNADDSPRRRQLSFKRMNNLVVGTSGGTYG